MLKNDPFLSEEQRSTLVIYASFPLDYDLLLLKISLPTWRHWDTGMVSQVVFTQGEAAYVDVLC